jgi:mono/diheme cytochrome c family protein
MMRNPLARRALLIFALAAAAWSIAQSRAQASTPGQSFDLMEGEQLYQTRCAYCHDATSKGRQIGAQLVRTA